MSGYLVSVIIPTRNRQQYCEATVRQICSVDEKNIQIIINDNSDVNSLEENLRDIVDGKRVIYNYIEERISAVDNYNMAAGFATGEYFCALGDDDGILPSIVDCAQWMKEKNIDVVCPFRNLSYYWPDKNGIKGYSWSGGSLSVDRMSNRCESFDSKEQIIKLLKNGGQDYGKMHLAGSYHCLVNRNCMETVKNITGKYYGGISPDMYSVACLSLLDINLVEIGMPITIPGVCPKSTSADGQQGRHVGELKDAPHFIGMKEPYVWDDRIPALYSVETIWSECLLKAITEMGREDLIDEYFNYDRLYEKIYENNPSLRNKLVDLIHREIDTFSINKKVDSKLVLIIKKFFSRLSILLDIILKRQLVVRPCDNIAIAQAKTTKFMSLAKYKKMWNSIISKV